MRSVVELVANRRLSGRLGMILGGVWVLAILLNAAAVQANGGDAARGKTKVLVCSACHGADGNSVTGQFPSIAGQNARYAAKQMRDIKSGARAAPLMVGMLNAFTEQDILDVAAFYASQPAKIGAAKADLAELGEQIYRAGVARKKIAACTGCHSPTGLGNAAAGFPRLGGQWAEYTVAQLRAFRVGDRSNDGDGHMMRDVAMDLSDLEIEAVASYIAGLH